MRKFSKVLAMLLVLVMAVSCFAACGAEYPARNISMVVPFGTGGGTDVYGRLVASGMEPGLGKSVPVTNVTGGTAGSMGVNQVWTAKHDGYTICATSETPLLIPVQVADMSQTSKDWTYFVTAGSPGIVAMNAKKAESLGIKTIADLAALSDKSQLKIAGCSGGLWFVLGQLLVQEGWDFNWVAYAGSGPAITATVGGKDADIVVASAQECNSYIKSGELLVLANMDKEDYKTYPAITKTLPGLESYFPLRQWLGFKVPADTDAAVVAKLTEAFEAYVGSQEFKDYAAKDETEVFGLTGDAAKAFVADSESKLTWTLFELGLDGVADPSTKGIAKP